MEIKVFTTEKIESSFELGGLEFYGKKFCFTKDKYSSQDLQMIFITLLNLAFAIRKGRSKFNLSSKITIYYRKKEALFYINNILIDKVNYNELKKELSKTIILSISLLKDAGIPDSDSVVKDLNAELIDLN